MAVPFGTQSVLLYLRNELLLGLGVDVDQRPECPCHDRSFSPKLASSGSSPPPFDSLSFSSSDKAQVWPRDDCKREIGHSGV